MKRKVKWASFGSILVLLWWLSAICDPLDAEQDIVITFENIFPDTPFKNVLDTTMQLWSNIKELEQIKTKEDKEILQDLILGRLFRLNASVEGLMKKYHEILHQDMAYLKSVINEIESDYQKNSAETKNNASIMISTQLSQIKKRIDLPFL